MLNKDSNPQPEARRQQQPASEQIPTDDFNAKDFSGNLRNLPAASGQVISGKNPLVTSASTLEQVVKATLLGATVKVFELTPDNYQEWVTIPSTEKHGVLADAIRLIKPDYGIKTEYRSNSTQNITCPDIRAFCQGLETVGLTPFILSEHRPNPLDGPNSHYWLCVTKTPL